MSTGRPTFEPTDIQRTSVSELAACGVRQEIIAKRIGIDPKTLRKVFRRELREGKADACAVVAESLFKKATGDGKSAVAAAIFWLKTQAGWKETTALEHTGKDSKPLTPPTFGISFADGGPGNPGPDLSPEDAYMRMINGGLEETDETGRLKTSADGAT
jgi:hypothetical protein